MSGAGIEVETRELGDLTAFFKRLPEIADHAAQLSVNDSARFARRVGGDEILDEVNYPRSYLRGENGRLSITKFATRGDPEAEVKGRDRPTSLARFSAQRVRFGRQRGIKVKVSRKGATKTLEHAFYMKLRRGQSFDGENFNVGLAVRVRKGEKLRNSTAALELGNGLYLLYGPSVDQVFGGVAEDIIDSVSDHLEDEFIRQFERLSTNG
jgi:hypothetical protein